MKQERKQKVYSFLIGVIILLVFQFSSYFLNEFIFFRQIQVLEFGTKTFLFALLFTVLDILSGIVLAHFIITRSHQKKKGINPINMVILGLVPFLAIIYRLFFSLLQGTLQLIPSLRYVYVGEWAIYSSTPGLWLGLLIGWFLKKRIFM